jgi:peptidoglycan/LPS O-acetylase OafA/YrhL
MSETATTATGKPRLDALHGMRFFAAMHVVLIHFGVDRFDRVPRWMYEIIFGAPPVLTLLFVLSGFVVTYGYGEDLAAGKLEAKTFWIGRFARIYPLYAAAFALDLIMTAQHRSVREGSYFVGGVLYLTGLQSWWPPYDHAFNGPGWTLSTELVFYMLFPWVVVRVLRMPRWQILAAMFVLWVYAVAVPLWVTVVNPDGPERPVMFFHDLARRCPLARVPDCLLGVGTAVLFLRARARGPIAYGGAMAIFGIVVSLTIVSKRYLWFGPACDLTIGNGALAPLFCLIIYGLSAGGIPSRILATPTLVHLGVSSYAMYIFQFPLEDFFETFVVPRWTETPWYLAQWIVVLVTFGVVVHDWIEEPLRRAIVRYSRRTDRTYSARSTSSCAVRE